MLEKIAEHAPVYKKPLPFPIVQETAGHVGYTILWVVFALMLLSSISYIVMAFRLKKEMRLFHYITTMITLTAALSYYAMATHGGTTYARVGKDHFRQIFYARYVDWSITTPLLLLDLAFLAGTSGIDIVALIFADLGMILTGLFASLESHKVYRFGWWAMGCVFYLYIVYALVFIGRTTASARGNKVSQLFDQVAFLTLLLWTAYPVVWAVSEGLGLVNVDTEIGIYAVLDVTAKAVFGFWLLGGHAKTPESAVPLEGFWINGVSLGGQNDLA
ncbi:putative opsin-like protein [Protomyces lactucae-debilis]|uniref:Putative opsin-like protein n=1 Tax=Protomyces lactucae-debilis TaxID=2754530 RepID=A0A1Y2EW84_PROLT|nr:putative opsin-like protein [Protomyces lactucae-debilis]ORY75396.1 putative opsin-like protein [Protomyces lactucae-debilis]